MGQAGLEPATIGVWISPLPSRWATDPYCRSPGIIIVFPMRLMSWRYEPLPDPTRAGADNGNRTRVTSLEGWCSAIELHPHIGGFRTLYFGIITTNQARFMKKALKGFPLFCEI